MAAPPLDKSTAAQVIDEQINDASEFAALPNDVIVHQIDTGEVYKKRRIWQ